MNAQDVIGLIQPRGNNLLLEVIKIVQQGSIMLPENLKMEPIFLTKIIAKGPGKLRDGNRTPIEFEVGQIVGVSRASVVDVRMTGIGTGKRALGMVDADYVIFTVDGYVAGDAN